MVTLTCPWPAWTSSSRSESLQPRDSPLRRRVDGHPRCRHGPGGGGDVHDAAVPAAILDHGGQELVGDVHRCERVDVHRRICVRLVVVIPEVLAAHHAGVVDEHVGTTVRIPYLGGRRADGFEVGDVDDVCADGAPRFAQFLRRAFERVGVDVPQHHRSAWSAAASRANRRPIPIAAPVIRTVLPAAENSTSCSPSVETGRVGGLVVEGFDPVLQRDLCASQCLPHHRCGDTAEQLSGRSAGRW